MRKKFLVLIAMFAALSTFSVQADQWVTPKTPKLGHQYLGRVVFHVEIRPDGTVKRAWPAQSGVPPKVAWRATRSVKELKFQPGSERTAKIPVTIFLD
jgi:hypothetical protein